ncbi:hypothetical protein ACFL2Q_18865 [Thermodesulfobacteriota bacterium]
MHRKRFCLAVASMVLAMGIFFQVSAQSSTPWPKLLQVPGYQVLIHRPQIDSQHDRSGIEAKLAVEVIPKGAKDSIVGAVWFSVDTTTDSEKRSVSFTIVSCFL